MRALWLSVVLLFFAPMIMASALEDERARNEEKALSIWPEVADPESRLSKEVHRLLNFYTTTQDPRLNTVNAPMWIASEAAANVEPYQTVPEAQQTALRLYPALAVLDSPLNKLFRDTYHRYAQVNPDYFNDPRWPIKLAQQCVTQIDAINATGKSAQDPAEVSPSRIRPWVARGVLLMAGVLVALGIYHYTRRMRPMPPRHGKVM